MTIPLVSATGHSAVSSYRAAWGIWTGLSLLCAAGYLHVAMLHHRLLQGLVPGSTFLVQAPFLSGLYAASRIWQQDAVRDRKLGGSCDDRWAARERTDFNRGLFRQSRNSRPR